MTLRWSHSLCTTELYLSLIVSITEEVTSVSEVYQHSWDIQIVLGHTRRFRVGILVDFKQGYFIIKSVNIIQYIWFSFFILFPIFWLYLCQFCVSQNRQQNNDVHNFPKYYFFMKLYICDNFMKFRVLLQVI
jgi:hypothetical protein